MFESRSEGTRKSYSGSRMSVFDLTCMRDKVGGRGRRKERKLEQREQAVHSSPGECGTNWRPPTAEKGSHRVAEGKRLKS